MVKMYIPDQREIEPFYLAVLCEKGGVGKTTFSVHLAKAADLRGYRTALWDCDSQRGASNWYEQARSKGDGRVEGLTFEALPAALKLPEYARKGAGYEVVIMDGPPRLGDVSEALAVLADLALIPVLPGMHDWNALADTWDRLDRADQIRAHLKRPRPPVARVLLLNRACEGTTVYRHAREALAKVTGASLAPVAVHHAPQALANMQGGECVFLDYPGSSAAAELARLADLYLPTRPAGLAAAGGAR